jgi:hypothetical protein
MPLELVYFHRGLSYDARSSLQKGGFLKTCKNINLETEGTQTLRDSYGVFSRVDGDVHSLKMFKGNLLHGHKGVVTSVRTNTSEQTELYKLFGTKPWQFEEYKDFLLGTNQKQFILVDEYNNVYPTQVDNPATACAGDTGVAGNPDGIYALYCSFYITWPNGQTYETGFSPVSSDVTVSSQKIEWSDIPVSTYTAYYGTAPTIYRKLYRGAGTGGTLTDIYYVDTIADNTTTTYSDNFTDAELEANDYETVADYLPTIIPKYFTAHYGRLHMISADYPHRLYWTEEALGSDASENESLMPLAITDTNWDDMRVSGLKEVDPQGIITWGINLFIPLKQTWLRREGNDPTTWAYRKTYSKNGIGAPYTLDVSTYPGGIIGLTNPEGGDFGLTVFNGQYDKVLTSPRLDWIFKNDFNVDAISTCRGKCVGRYYHFLYPSATSSVPDKHLAIDLRRYPDIRVAEWTGLNGQCIETDMESTKVYFGCADGYVRSQGNEYVDFELETHDMVGGSAELTNEQKTFQEIKYALDSNGNDVTLKVYIDDVLMKYSDGSTTKTISGTSETLQYIRSLPKDWVGYRIRLNLSGTDMSKVEIYSPWKILFQVGG